MNSINIYSQTRSVPNKITEAPSISVIVLTFNEEKHIARCITSVQTICRNIFIIDSFSTDNTLSIAESLGAKCFQHKWENNHALQFNWGLKNIPIDTDWVMRLDADEYILPELAIEIKKEITAVDSTVAGINLNRRVIFMNKWIRRGGYYPTTLLRIWRTGAGFLEQRWMDEHVKLEWGGLIQFKQDFVDHNLNSLSWWINKHNNYATREAVDFLINKYGLSMGDSISSELNGVQNQRKRWFKETIYFKLPLFLRPLFYFIFRYFFKLGFLDGKEGLMWHVLQGFWYRFLVDSKIYEFGKNSAGGTESFKQYLEKEFGIRLDSN